MKLIKFEQEVCSKCDLLNQLLVAMDKKDIFDEVIMITDDNVEEIKSEYGIMGTPTLLAFEDNKEVARLSTTQYSDISSFFEKVGI